MVLYAGGSEQKAAVVHVVAVVLPASSPMPVGEQEDGHVPARPETPWPGYFVPVSTGTCASPSQAMQQPHLR